MNFRYRDPDGDSLEVVPSPAASAVKLLAADISDGQRTCILVQAADLPALVAAMYEATGQPAPVLLDRPEIIPAAQASAGRIRVRAKGRDVWLVASENNSYLVEDPRALAAALVAVQERVEAADLERVAAFFGEAVDTDPMTLARRFLSHFKVEERAS